MVDSAKLSSQRRALLNHALKLEQVGDILRSSECYRRVLCEHSDWALRKKCHVRLLGMWRTAIQNDSSLENVADQQHELLQHKSTHAGVRAMALTSRGDLCRYRHRLNESRVFYEQAIRECSSSIGKPFNQLGVTLTAIAFPSSPSQSPRKKFTQNITSSLRIVYNHYRALTATQSFPAHANLLEAYDSVAQRHQQQQHHHHHHYGNDEQHSNHRYTKKHEWVRAVILAHHACMTNIDLDEKYSALCSSSRDTLTSCDVPDDVLCMFLILFTGIVVASSSSPSSSPEAVTIAIKILCDAFGWRMSRRSLCATTKPSSSSSLNSNKGNSNRSDISLALFCIWSCDNIQLVRRNSSRALHTHIMRLLASFEMDLIIRQAYTSNNSTTTTTITPSSSKNNNDEAICDINSVYANSIRHIMNMCVGVPWFDSIHNWASLVSTKLYLSDTFLEQSVSTLSKLLSCRESDSTINNINDDEDDDDDEPQSNPLIVIDAPNVAMKHGNNKFFSTAGIVTAIRFFHTRRCRVVGVLAEHCLSFQAVADQKRLARLDGYFSKASATPDNVYLLKLLLSNNFLISTPSKDYDDSYCLEYARRHDGVVLSNDRYRDAVQNEHDPLARKQLAQWLRDSVCTFTFAGDEIIPNPDFKWPQYHRERLCVMR